MIVYVFFKELFGIENSIDVIKCNFYPINSILEANS